MFKDLAKLSFPPHLGGLIPQQQFFLGTVDETDTNTRSTGILPKCFKNFKNIFLVLSVTFFTLS